MHDKKRIMIFGSTGGIGSSCAEYLNSPDTELYLVGRNEDKLKLQQQNLLRNCSTGMEVDAMADKQRVVTLVADIHSPECIKDLFQYFKDNKIRLDGLVYSVGVEGVMPLKMLNRDYLTNVIEANCVAFIELCKYFSSKRTSKDGSSVVAISSMASCMNYIGELAYCVSKAALDSAVRGTAKELLSRKIRVNAVLPGTVETDMLVKARERVENFDERVLKSQPLGIIDARQIAYLVSFLLSEKSAYITGACIPVGAGRIV